MSDILNRARELRAMIENMSTNLDDTSALTVIELFPRWKIDKEYVIDERVSYNDILYKCLQSHTSQESWNPIDASSLWTRVLIPDPEVIPEWIQPDSTNPYMIGDKVIHNEKTWESIVDNNVWEPGVYGWNEVT